eukprot:FR737064.1.p2 GENE.FR737064.1~~FR737064.1.p2  ORF type:complete len:107 (+),score=3.87 FR737064.1:94-414(+)
MALRRGNGIRTTIAAASAETCVFFPGRVTQGHVTPGDIGCNLFPHTQPFEACCPDCKVPGDDCPPVWGSCNHAFHMHCIVKWLQAQQTRQMCPMCRREWQFRGDAA